MPATFFLTTDGLDREEPYEDRWDVLERSLLGASSAAPAALDVELPGGKRRFSMTTPTERLAAHKVIYDAIVRLPADVRDAVVTSIRELASLYLVTTSCVAG